MTTHKNRRAINISLQSKKYAEPINEMIQSWEDENLNISTQVCDALLFVERLKRFSSLSNIFKIVNMLDGLSSIYGYTSENIDEMLQEIIMVDNDRFSEILIRLNDMKFDENVMKKMKEKRSETTKLLKEETKEKIVENTNHEKNLEEIEKKEVQEDKIEKTSEKNQIEEEMTEEMSEIPLDFLFNS